MSETIIRIAGPGAQGQRLDGALLRDLMDPLVDAVQQSLRLRTEGRSRAPGSAPVWLAKAAAFDIEFRKGPTKQAQAQLALLAEPLGRVVPERFAQLDMFDAFSPNATCIDVFVEALDDALTNNANSDRYDDGLIETFTAFGRVLDHDVNSFELRNGATRRIERESVESLKQLRRSIPSDQRVRIAGKLEMLKHSSRIFSVELPTAEVRGVLASDADVAAYGRLLGQEVIVSGVAKFRPSGRVLRVEADQIVPASGDTGLWKELPRPLFGDLDTRSLRVPQGPRSGISALFGQWPGDESDDELDAAVRARS